MSAAQTLFIIDEFHNLSGKDLTLATTPIFKILHSDFKILSLSATPRVFDLENHSAESDYDALFGPKAYSMKMSEAINKGIITDYQVFCPLITEEGDDEVKAELSVDVIDDQMLARAVFLCKGMLEYGARKCIVYLTTKEEVKEFYAVFTRVADQYFGIGPGLYCSAILADDAKEDRADRLNNFSQAADFAVLLSIKILNEAYQEYKTLIVLCSLYFAFGFPDEEIGIGQIFVSKMCNTTTSVLKWICLLFAAYKRSVEVSCQTSHPMSTRLTEKQIFYFDKAKQYIDTYGFAALNISDMTKHGHDKLYNVLLKYKLKVSTVASLLGRSEEFERLRQKRAKDGKARAIITSHQVSWNQDTFDDIAREIVQKYNCIPATSFLSANNYHMFVTKIKEFAQDPSSLREKFDNGNAHKLRSADGKVWLSFAETCLANFQIARGIGVMHGRLYPDAYALTIDRQCGRYDMHFTAVSGDLSGKEILVEVWGGGIAANSDRYAATRKATEDFHNYDKCFLGIEYKDCYKEIRLTTLLEPYIGSPNVTFSYSGVPTCQSSVFEMVVQECKHVYENMPDKLLPSQNWLLRNGSYSERHVLHWEAPSWAGLCDRITAIGTDKIRQALGEDPKFRQWTIDMVLEEFQRLFQKYHLTASTISKNLRKLDHPTVEQIYDLRTASCAYAAAQRLKCTTPMSEIYRMSGVQCVRKHK